MTLKRGEFSVYIIGDKHKMFLLLTCVLMLCHNFFLVVRSGCCSLCWNSAPRRISWSNSCCH